MKYEKIPSLQEFPVHKLDDLNGHKVELEGRIYGVETIVYPIRTGVVHKEKKDRNFTQSELLYRAILQMEDGTYVSLSGNEKNGVQEHYFLTALQIPSLLKLAEQKKIIASVQGSFYFDGKAPHRPGGEPIYDPDSLEYELIRTIGVKVDALTNDWYEE